MNYSWLLAILFTVAATAAPPIVEVYNAASMIPAAVQTVAQGSRFVFRFTGTGIGPNRRVGSRDDRRVVVLGADLLHVLEP